ncbi:ABC transporter ATP-binding protein [Spirochaeta dissipatitropha]
MDTILEVQGLSKSYGSTRALHDLNLSIPRGEIFGLLGHNGAGKTTSIECILGTKKADAGSVKILGMDPAPNRRAVFARTGVQFQQNGFQDKLRVAEACRMAEVLYPQTQNWKELLERFHLNGKEKSCVNDLSGGERQKLCIVLALIGKPELLFLDELTSGLDTQARRGIWQYLKELQQEGVSIVLSSHYMDEVEYLCDRILILQNGITAAAGTPASLIAEHNTNREIRNLEDVLMCYMNNDTEKEK